MVSGGEVIRVGGAATRGRGILGVLGRRPEGWRADRREISGFDFPSALVGIAPSEDEGFGRGFGCGGGFVQYWDEDFCRLFFSNFCGFFGEDFQFRFVLCFIGSVVEVEGAG